MELVENAADVGLDGGLCNELLARDLAVRQAFGDSIKDLPLARGERSQK
jgi:hypothetical protein